jgi:eukaryotic-like serine/threonine-protein kinase
VNHPTDDELRALSLGRLGEAELAVVAAHLGDCPACGRRVEVLSGDDPLQARLRQSAARRVEVLVNPTQRRSAVRALRHGSASGASGRRRDSGPVTLPMPREVGDYDILAEVGRGGMGVVYRARHRGLHRVVALKMVLAGEFMSPAQETRFRLEAELAARVQHPNIVQVHEIGTHDGRPFLALEWVEGGNLASQLDGKPWPPGEAAALVETLARAIHVAHGEGVVHRDLKPANILLGSDERGVMSDESKPSSLIAHHSSLRPKVADFGLAQPTEGGQTLTYSGFLVGTPGYMAPEQAGGKRALVGPATDIYALGVVLYQLLTGQLPFRGDSTLEVLRAVMSDEPVRPRRLQPRLPRDLEAITLHCLEKEPGRRYPSALALAEDLERFRAGTQVVARPVGAAARLARAARRRPVIALLLALLAASLAAGVGGVTWKWLEADEQRDQATALAHQAGIEKQSALHQAYRARLAAAGAALQNHDVADAARQLEAAPEELRGWEWQHLYSRLDDSSATFPAPAGDVLHLVQTSAGPWVVAQRDDHVRVTDLDGREILTRSFGPEKHLNYPAQWTPKGLWLLDPGGAIRRLTDRGRIRTRLQDTPRAPFFRWAMSPDGSRLATAWGVWGAEIVLHQPDTGKRTGSCAPEQSQLWDLAFSPDGTRLASAHEDGVVCVWDAGTGTLAAQCRGHTSKVLSVAFRPDGARLLTASADGTVRQWDPGTGRELEPPYDRHAGDVLRAVYSPDGRRVASGGTDRSVRVWRAAGRQDIAVLHGHTGCVTYLAFAADDRRLASVSQGISTDYQGDQTLRVWEAAPEAGLPVLRGHTKYIYPVAYSPDGRWVASGSWDWTVRLWDAATGEPCAPPLPQHGTVRALAFGPDGTWLATAGDNFPLRIWDVATARVRKEIPLPFQSVPYLAVSPDGARIVATGYDGGKNRLVLNVIDVATGKTEFSGAGCAFAFSPDGKWLAGWEVDDTSVVLWDTQTFQPSVPWPGHRARITAVTFSPDGRRLASVSTDRTVRVWRAATGECEAVLSGHTDDVFAAAFHPAGTRLATAGRDRAIWLWDLTRGEEVARLPGHTSYVWSLAFSPDGTTLVSGSGDGTVRLWDTAPLKTRYQARREAAALRPEAERLVEQLWRQKNAPDDVADALRADRALGEALRHASLREVLRRSRPPEAAPR